MKNKKINLFISVYLLFAVVLVSCKYEEFADAEYPENCIYQSTAVNGVWTIDKATEENSSLLTPGNTTRYILDKPNRKFIVPLGIIQSGIGTYKACNVAVASDNDTINILVATRNLLPDNTLLLPSSAYTLPSSIDFPSGCQYTSFNLEIDLNALTGSNLGSKYAVAVKISSTMMPVTRKLATTIILIDTVFLEKLLE